MGGSVNNTGSAVAMPQGNKPASKPVHINQLSGTFKKGGKVKKYQSGGAPTEDLSKGAFDNTLNGKYNEDMDMAKYDERFYSVIDYLLLTSYGPECYDLISFYLWERMDEKGESLSLVDSQGNEINMQSPYDLWDMMIKINTKIK
jgi:hypothetical protein